jgi:hypothetical protein
MTPRTLRLVAIVALLALPLPAIALDLDCKFSADRHGSIDATGAERVEIVARAGDLVVRPSAGSTLTAAGRACASSEAFLAQTLLHVRRTGNVVQVQVQVPESMQGIGIFYASLDLKVQVPGGLPVAITDSSGDVTADDVRVVRIHDSSGDIVVHRARSVTIPRDSSGDISIERVAGNVRIEQDSSGDISVSDVGGNVELLADGSGQVRVSAVKGTVRLP